MELEKLVITELEDMDLNGAKIIHLECEPEIIKISFEIGDVKVDFTAISEAVFQIDTIADAHTSQVYTDEVMIKKCDGWVKYILAIVYPLVKKHRVEQADIANNMNDQQRYQELLMTIEDAKREIEQLEGIEDLYPEKEQLFSMYQDPPAPQKKKIYAIIGNVVFYTAMITIILGFSFFGLQEPGAAPRRIFGHSLMTVLSGSMYPTIPQDSLVVMRVVDQNHLEVGDIVTYITQNNIAITHRIVDIIENYQGNGERGFRLKGDNNIHEDATTVHAANVLGEIVYWNLSIGQIIVFIQIYIVQIVILLVMATAIVYVIKKFLFRQLSSDGKSLNTHDVTKTKQLKSHEEVTIVEDVEKKRKQRNFRKYLKLTTASISVIVLFYSTYRVMSIKAAYREIEGLNEELRESYTVVIDEGEDFREFLTIDWEGLQERNEDVVAWLYVPGTNINYPILAGATNEEYLSLDIDRQHSIAGSIFLEENNSSAFTDLHTIVYGHNMVNGSKFTTVDAFVTGEMTELDAPYVYLYLPNGIVNIYQVVGAQLTDIDSMIYRLPVTDIRSFYELMLEENVMDVDFDLEQHARVLTLSTCAVVGVNSPIRSVVFAVLVEEHEL